MNNVKDNLLVKWNFIQFLIVNRFLFVHILYAYLSYLFYIFTLQMFFFLLNKAITIIITIIIIIMLRTHYPHLDLLSLVFLPRVFWLSAAWNLRKAKRWSKGVLHGFDLR